MSPKPVRTHLTMASDQQAFDKVINCSFLMLSSLQSTEFSISGFA